MSNKEEDEKGAEEEEEEERWGRIADCVHQGMLRMECIEGIRQAC